MPVDLARLKRSRQSIVEAGGFRFTIERPTQYEIVSAGGVLRADLDFIARHVVGWDLKESDLIPGGDPVPADFNADVLALWLADQPALWAPLAKGMRDAFQAWEEAQDVKGKA